MYYLIVYELGDDLLPTLVILGVAAGGIYIAVDYFQKNPPYTPPGNGNGNGNPPPPTAGIGKDGVSFIYPTGSGWVWYMDMNNPADGYLNFGGGSNFSKLIKNPDGSWRANDNVDVKFNIIVNRGENSGKPDAIGGCGMNFTDCVNRGYAHAPNDIGRRGVEMTGFFKVYGPLGHNSHDSIPGIFMKGPWSHHPGTAGECCQEVEYYHVLETNGTLHYVKEGSQNNIFPNPKTFKIPNFNMIGAGWFGLKYIFRNETTNKSDPKVRLKSYFNRNGDGKTWEPIGEMVDNVNSKWGNPKATCGGKAYQVYAWANSGMVIKFYTSRVDFKKWSIREIA